MCGVGYIREKIVATIRTCALFYMKWEDMARAGADKSYNTTYTMSLPSSRDIFFHCFLLGTQLLPSPGSFPESGTDSSRNFASLNMGNVPSP